MAELLYKWPVAAKFGSRVPKEKFYEYGTVSTLVREKFVSEVQRITWGYKLAESTINLPGDRSVPEIQVFQIDAKTADIDDRVLFAIDKAVHYPLIFEVKRATPDGQQIRMTAAHKQLGSGALKLSAYFSTGWFPEAAERQSLPTATTLSTLYVAILEPLAPVKVRPGEGMAEVADRLEIVSKLEREITALERKLRTEPQLNRKIELRRILKAKHHEIEQQR